MKYFTFSTTLSDNDELSTWPFIARWLRRHHRLAAGTSLRADALLDHDLGLDSIERVELVVDLENHYHVLLPDEELGTLKTVQDVEMCLQRQLRKVAA